MAITKLGTRRKARLNDATLTIRLPKVIEEQLVQVSHAQFKAPSQVVRDLILQYIQNQAFLANNPMQHNQGVNQSSVREGFKPSQHSAIYDPRTDPNSPEYDEWA